MEPLWCTSFAIAQRLPGFRNKPRKQLSRGTLSTLTFLSDGWRSNMCEMLSSQTRSTRGE